MAAAAAVPIIANMLMPKPDVPQPNQVPISPQSALQSQYNPAMMNNAFSTNSPYYKAAADEASAQVQSQLAKSGLSTSSAGFGANADVQAKIARDWQQHSLQNQEGAMSTLNNQVGLTNQVNEFNTGNNNQAAIAAYNAAMAQRNQIISGLGGAGGAFAGSQNQQPQSQSYNPYSGGFSNGGSGQYNPYSGAGTLTNGMSFAS